MIDLKELHSKYYDLLSGLYCNRAQMSPKQFETMSKTIYGEYMYDIDRYIMERNIAEGQTMFKLRLQNNSYVPRKGFLWRLNKVGKAIRKIHRKDYELLLAELELQANLTQKDISECKAQSQSTGVSQEPQTALAPIMTTVISSEEHANS